MNYLNVANDNMDVRKEAVIFKISMHSNYGPAIVLNIPPIKNITGNYLIKLKRGWVAERMLMRI